MKDTIEIFSWVKDKDCKFMSCTENLAELAGEDSPTSMRSKDDFSLIWRKDALTFRKIDERIIKKEVNYINVIEIIDAIENNRIVKNKILITKLPVFDNNGDCIGIAGSHIKLQEYQKNYKFDENGRLWLYNELKAEYLTKSEVNVLRYVIQNKTSKQIAKILNLSFRTVEDHIKNIKKKLQCGHKNEIIFVANEFGLTHI